MGNLDPLLRTFVVFILIVDRGISTTEGVKRNTGPFLSRLGSSFLPTYWCGFLNSAPYYEALSRIYPMLDKCCRQHDGCSEYIDRKTCIGHLCNPSAVLPILNCRCEDRFKKCLQDIRRTSDSLKERTMTRIAGYVYFNILLRFTRHKCLSENRSKKSVSSKGRHNDRDSKSFPWSLADVKYSVKDWIR